jgi:hypothetical protein
MNINYTINYTILLFMDNKQNLMQLNGVFQSSVIAVTYNNRILEMRGIKCELHKPQKRPLVIRIKEKIKI